MGDTVADQSPPESGGARLIHSSHHAIRGPARRA